MQDAGVPCIPGYQGEDQSDERLLSEARRIGFPVMIKATAGGGGRGIRLVQRAEDFADQLRSAKSEARSAFGDEDVLLERTIVEPRHIEIQVMADRHGNAIHLGERDCSVQRRHQKVIEEAPSPAVDAELRERMGAVAVKAVLAIAYEGAGTLEFLLDREGNFYFMEMNTRLQVEHPVTEAITGLDLVELQLRVAGGQRLPLTQDQVRFSGHAIEVRLCAEDTATQFMPQSGHMALWRESELVRVEHGLNRRSDIPPYYDSMVAKVVAHGHDRDEARRRLLHGLADTVALGVKTNQAFLAACLDHPVFTAGQATTAFIGQHQDSLLAADPAQAQQALALAAALFYSAVEEPIPHAFELPLRLSQGGTLTTAVMTHEAGEGCTVLIGEQRFEIQLLELGEHDVRYTCNGVGRKAAFYREGATLGLHALGRPWHIEDMTCRAALRHTQAGSDGTLRASMNGRVVAITVTVGDTVQSGQAMLTLEAMKMEHIHAAPLAGRVKALHVSLGEQVGAHRVVAEVEAL
jgi:geranyl-CoA carboxylase alpha subunit